MKVVYLNDYPFGVGFGGKEVHLLSFVSHINRLYYPCVSAKLFDWWNKSELEDSEIIHLFGHAHFYDIIKMIKANKNQSKIVLSPTIYYTGWKFKKLAFFIGSNLPFPNFYKNIKFEIEHSNIILVNSENEKKYILNNISNNSDIRVLYNAIEDDFNILDDSLKDVFLNKYNIKKHGYILSVGMLDERKNSINMIKSFISVHKSLDKKLVIIGSPRFSKKQNRNIFFELIKKYQDIIIYIPYIDRDSKILKSAYLNCAFHYLPSYVETPGIANLEALYFGKNIVVGDCPPVREYFMERPVYCDPSNINDMKKALLICNDLPYYNLENIRFIQDKYLYSIIIEKLINIYKSL